MNRVKARYLVFFSLLAVIVLMPFIVYGDSGLVPCGIVGTEDTAIARMCNICDLVTLLQKLLNEIWDYLVIPIAAIMFTYGGFLMFLPGIGGEKTAGSYAKGKTVITNVIIGIAIAFFAWLGVDTVIKLFGGKFYAGSQDANFGPWNVITCEVQKPPTTPPTTPPPTTLCTSPGTTEDGVDVCAPGTKEFTDESLKNPEGTSLKTDRSGACVDLSSYESSISAACSGQTSCITRVKAIITIESSGMTGAASKDNDGKSSYGLMQIRPDTARTLDSSLAGKSDADVAAALKNPSTNIKLGTLYYQQLLSKYGSSDLASSAYNGGPVANKDSVNCKGLKRWQCPWDSNGCYGTSKTDCVPNTRSGHPGYGVTRSYVPKVNGIEAKIKDGTCK